MMAEPNTLKPFEFNEKYFDILKGTDYNALKDDIKRRGIKTNLHCLPDNVVICGNQRLKIALELGLKEVPVQYVYGLETEEDIIEYVIKDNLLRRHLSVEQKAYLVKELYDLRMKGWGGDRKSSGQVDHLISDPGRTRDKIAHEFNISPGSVKRLLKYASITEEEPDLKGQKLSVALKVYDVRKKAEEREKVLKKATIKLQSQLFQGNSAEKLALIPSDSVDCVIMDPPYNINFKSYSGKGTNDFVDSIDEDTLNKVFKELDRVTKQDSHIYCFMGFQNYEMFKNLLSLYFDFKNTLIWVKNDFTPCDFRYSYAHQYEMVLFFSKGRRVLSNISVEDYGGKPLNPISRTLMGKSSDVFMFQNDINKQHSAQKPINLLRYLIANSTMRGEVVLDCFAGSGSTLVASEMLNRKWYGIEAEAHYCEIATQRILEVKNADKQ